MSGLRIETDDAALAEMFDWAVTTARGFVVADGTKGPLDVSEADAPPYRQAEYRASYHAGYRHRSGYYLRDFAHQALGAHLLGLQAENRAMLDSFVRTATPEHGGWPVWALNFDRVTPLSIDYRGPDRFVRELPAAFELVELIHVLYRWTGDRGLLDHRAHWRQAVDAFVAERDHTLPNGVAEAQGPGIFDGAASYNERPGEHLLEAGDGFAAQYAALRHAAALEAAGDPDGGEGTRFAACAAALAAEFRDRWSRPQGRSSDRALTGFAALDGLVSAYLASGEPVTGWLREGTWFLPLKGLLTAGDPRRDGLLDAIDAASRHPQLAPTNIEALSYLPDVFLRHGRPDTADEWMRLLYARRDDAHEVPQQGRNGTYPELSFTLVGQIAAGFLGLEPDAAAMHLTTRPAPPSSVGRLAVHGVPFGDGTIDVGWERGGAHWVENRTPLTLVWHPEPRTGAAFHDPHLGEDAASAAVLVQPGQRRSTGAAAAR